MELARNPYDLNKAVYLYSLENRKRLTTNEDSMRISRAEVRFMETQRQVVNSLWGINVLEEAVNR